VNPNSAFRTPHSALETASVHRPARPARHEDQIEADQPKDRVFAVQDQTVAMCEGNDPDEYAQGIDPRTESDQQQQGLNHGDRPGGRQPEIPGRQQRQDRPGAAWHRLPGRHQREHAVLAEPGGQVGIEHGQPHQHQRGIRNADEGTDAKIERPVEEAVPRRRHASPDLPRAVMDTSSG
jgi:hypothetical protein